MTDKLEMILKVALWPN